MMRATPIARAAAGLVAAALMLTGCSSSDDDAADAPTPIGPPRVAPPVILQAGTLKVCAPNDGTPPNVYRDAAAELVGSEVDLARALAAQLGLTAQFVESAFAAVIPTLQARQCDVIMAQLYVKPEREEVVDFVPYVRSGTGIAVSREQPAAVTGLDESLCGKKVILAVATTAESLAEEQSARCVAAGAAPVDITRSNQADVALQQVQNGQVDAFMDTAETLGYYATKTGARIDLAGAPFGTIDIGAATRKDDRALHDALGVAFAELVADGTYARILDEWGMSDLALPS